MSENPGDTRQLVPQDVAGETKALIDEHEERSIATYKSTLPARLRVQFPDRSEFVFATLYPHLVIGRKTSTTASQVDIDLSPFDEGVQGVSRIHAMIEPTREGLALKDLKSTNGTQLNGVVLKAAFSYPLRTGDLIKVGNLKLKVTFEYDE